MTAVSKNTDDMVALRDAGRVAVQQAIEVLGEAVTAETFAVATLLVARLRRALAHLLNARDELA